MIKIIITLEENGLQATSDGTGGDTASVMHALKDWYEKRYPHQGYFTETKLDFVSGAWKLRTHRSAVCS